MRGRRRIESGVKKKRGRTERRRQRRRQNGKNKVGGESLRMEGKEKMVGGDGLMDTGSGRSVGIRLSVLWYRVIVQRKNIEWLFKTATLNLLDPAAARTA